MKDTISRLLMMRRNKFLFLFAFFFFLGFNVLAQNRILSLDTSCVFNNEPLLIDLDIDHDEMMESNNKSFSIFSIDSAHYNSLMITADFFVDTIVNKQFVNIISDSQLVINGKNFHYLFSSEERIGEEQISRSDTTIFNGVLPAYWGMISKLNLAIVSTVDISGAYATTNLIDLKSGKIIQDLSSYDEGSQAYLPNKSNDYVLSFSNAFYEDEEAEVVIIKVVTKYHSYCLDLSTIINLKKQHIESLSWISKNSFCFSTIKNNEDLQQYNFYQVVLK